MGNGAHGAIVYRGYWVEGLGHMGNGAQGQLVTVGMGHMGNGVHGTMGYRGLGHMGNGDTWDNRVQRCEVQGVWATLGNGYRGYGLMVGTYKGLLWLCECIWDGGSICRWWGHLTTIGGNQSFFSHRWWGP